MFRKVRLATAGIAVVDALNWFFPDNLSSDIRAQLKTSEIPFGRSRLYVRRWHDEQRMSYGRHGP